MATDGPDPPPCKGKIFRKGTGVCVVDGRSNAVETWVRAVAVKANAQVDWHYSGGRANVLHLGNKKSRERVLQAIREMEGELDGRILSIDGPALYRKDVNDPDAIGAVVTRDDNGRLVLHDPEAVAFVKAVCKGNCRNTLSMHAERVVHFKRRIGELGNTPDDLVICLFNADDLYGGPLADSLVPNANWQQYRDRGEIPFARGLAERTGIQEILDEWDADAANKLRDMNDAAVVVVDHGVVEVFAA